METIGTMVEGGVYRTLINRTKTRDWCDVMWCDVMRWSIWLLTCIFTLREGREMTMTAAVGYCRVDWVDVSEFFFDARPAAVKQAGKQVTGGAEVGQFQPESRKLLITIAVELIQGHLAMDITGNSSGTLAQVQTNEKDIAKNQHPCHSYGCRQLLTGTVNSSRPGVYGRNKDFAPTAIICPYTRQSRRSLHQGKLGQQGRYEQCDSIQACNYDQKLGRRPSGMMDTSIKA